MALGKSLRKKFADPVRKQTDSVLHENTVESFLSMTVLEDRDFTAERSTIKPRDVPVTRIVRNRLVVEIPKRPDWKGLTPEQLHLRENHVFLEWRRSLAYMVEEEGILLTPFEKNIEMWKQLWRVVEKSQLLVQIVDARNPLLFKSDDFDAWVASLSKHCILLLNKADLTSEFQRIAWSRYFLKHGIPHVYFSAKMSLNQQEIDELEEKERIELAASKASEAELTGRIDASTPTLDDAAKESSSQSDAAKPSSNEADATRATIRRISRIIGADELLAHLFKTCPDTGEVKPVIGFVGYPNVGKSSTLNALIGVKKVSTGSTPGKTKHFQTIHLENAILCDCPGLVFPTSAHTHAEMVVSSIIPIDQLREVHSSAQLICEMIPKKYLEYFYTISIPTLDAEGYYEDREPTAVELLMCLARTRGWVKSSQGNPDEFRAARKLLKDFTMGALVHVSPPPGVSRTEFNKDLYKLSPAQLKKPDPTVNSAKGVETIDDSFFSQSIIRAHTNGKSPITDFSRVIKQMPSSDKKKHKKAQRKKKHEHWTATD